MFEFLVAFVVVSLAALIGASFIICVPKWWSEKVATTRFVRWLSSGGTRRAHGPGTMRVVGWFSVAGKVFAAVVFVPLFFVAGVVLMYIHAYGVLVEKACPYTHSSHVLFTFKKSWWTWLEFISLGKIENKYYGAYYVDGRVYYV